MSFPQKILIPLSDQVDTSLIEHKNVFESEGDRIALADIVDTDTKLLIHCDGEDESILFSDASKSEHSVVAFGNAEVDTAIKKFGTGAALLNPGLSYLRVPNHSDFNFLAGDFDVELQMYSTDFNQTEIFFSNRQASGFNGMTMRVASKRIRFTATFNNTSWDVDFTTTVDLVNSAWNHVALTREGNIFRVFQDGTERGSQTIAGTIDSTNGAVTISGDIFAGSYFLGSIDEIRIKKGVAVYISDFTPPTAAFPSYSSTSPSPAAVWTILPLGAEIDMSTAKCWMFKDGVIQPATNIDIKFKYAANNAALSSALTLAQLRAEIDPTITDDTNSFKAVGVYASDGSYESKSSAWLEVDAIFQEAGGGGLSIINGGLINV